jgi:NAD(P)H-nitrite reductase large subunit
MDVTEAESQKLEDDDVICHCYQVSETTIRACIKAGDLNTVDEVTTACKAGGGCHSCHILIDLFIDQKNMAVKAKKKSAIDKTTGVKKRGVFSKLFARF